MATATMTAVLRNASNAPALSTAMLLVQIIAFVSRQEYQFPSSVNTTNYRGLEISDLGPY